LENTSRANAWEPNDPAILTTIGAAQHRVGSYDDSLKTLAKSAQILSDAGKELDPVNTAFKAMTLQRIGRADEAKVALMQLRELCKEEQFAEDMEVQDLLAEGEKLIASEKQ
jgi:Flp pilus assembly protein TadD